MQNTFASADAEVTQRVDAAKALLKADTFQEGLPDGTRTTTNEYDQVIHMNAKPYDAVFEITSVIEYARDTNQPQLLQGLFADVSSSNGLYQEYVQAFPAAMETPGKYTGIFAPVEVNDVMVSSGTTGAFTATVLVALKGWDVTVEPIDGMWVITKVA